MVGAAGTDSVFDVQIMWDATTNRFYYAADDVVSNTNNKIAFGFSKTATPSSAADWCKYVVSAGSTFPDYPKLGDSQFFLMIGTNLFNGNNFANANVLAASKPKASDTCTTYGNTGKTRQQGALRRLHAGAGERGRQQRDRLVGRRPPTTRATSSSSTRSRRAARERR